MKYTSITLILSAFLLGCSSPGPSVNEEDFVLLEDLVHSRKQNTSITGSFDRLGYDDSHGYSSFKRYAEELGLKHAALKSGRLSNQVLENIDILFINLTDDKVNRFNNSEVDAIDDFVRSGGGLFIIVDHTNAYYSSERIAPVLELFDMSVSYHTAMEVRELTLKQNHWLLVPPERTTDHYVFSDIRHHAYLASGPILGPGSIAWTSDDGWRDTWDDSKPPSYWGNFTQDADEETTSSSVMNAIEHGDGRVLVAGDQNMFGNSYLGFADNRKLLANIFQWLGQKEDEAPFRDIEPTLPRMTIDFRTRDWNDWWTSGYSPFFSAMARQNAFFPEVAIDTPDVTPSVLILTQPENAIDASDIASPQTVLENDGLVFLFVDPADPTEVSLALLAELWPEFRLPEVLPGGDFEDATFEGIPGRDMEIEEDVKLLGPTIGELVYWIETADGETSPLIVKKDRLHVVVQPDVFHDGDFIYANEALYNYMAELL